MQFSMTQSKCFGFFKTYDVAQTSFCQQVEVGLQNFHKDVLGKGQQHEPQEEDEGIYLHDLPSPLKMTSYSPSYYLVCHILMEVHDK